MATRNYRNGERIDDDILLERAFVYADGVFETMRCHNQTIPLWSLHRQRLQRTSDRLKLDLDFLSLEKQLAQVLEQSSASDCVVKLVVGRAGQGRASYLPNNASSGVSTNHFFSVSELQCSPELQKVNLRKANMPLHGCTTLSGLKLINRLEYILATAGMNIQHNEEALFLDESGFVLECMHHNIFVVEGNKVITPHIGAAGVLGVMRAHVIQTLGPKLGLAIEERHITYSELANCDGVFVSNAVRGVEAVLSVDGNRVKQSTVVQDLHAECVELFLS